MFLTWRSWGQLKQDTQRRRVGSKKTANICVWQKVLQWGNERVGSFEEIQPFKARQKLQEVLFEAQVVGRQVVAMSFSIACPSCVYCIWIYKWLWVYTHVDIGYLYTLHYTVFTDTIIYTVDDSCWWNDFFRVWDLAVQHGDGKTPRRAQAKPGVNGDGAGVAKRQELQQKLERLQQQQEQLAGSPGWRRFDPIVFLFFNGKFIHILILKRKYFVCTWHLEDHLWFMISRLHAYTIHYNSI